MMMPSEKGFTLIEMLVATAVFITVIMIAGSSFNVILTTTSKLAKSEESNIEGVVGLEMLRHDLQQAGFGLPDSFLDPATPPVYVEATTAPASSYNDAPSGIPRAFAFGNDLAATVLAGTDYIAIKGTTLGAPAPNNTAQKWTYMPFSSAMTGKQKPRIWLSQNFVDNDLVIVIKRSFSGSTYINQLIYNTAIPSIYWARYYPDGFADPAFAPTLPEETYYLYGIRQQSSGSQGLGMPFNRSDYFVASATTGGTSLPSYCGPGTGVLYKTVVNHKDGGLQYIPLLDCVADMQVVLGWDLTDAAGNDGQDGVLETWSNADGTTVSPAANQARVTAALASAETIRNALKMVKVYLLAQVGKRDPNYTGPASFVVGDGASGEASMTRTYAMSATQRQYHWKVYRVIVRPKNLLSNQ